MNRIEKRAVEVLAVAPIIEALGQKFGAEEALAILREVNEKEAFHRGLEMAAHEEDVLNVLADDVVTWGDGGVLEMEVLEKTDNTYFFNVTRCPYHEKYKELGLEELGVAMSCCRDEPHARGLNPDLRLERTQTLMEGAEYCDFRYYLDSE